MPNIDRLRILREDRALTQKQIADHLSITQRTYSRYENGDRAIPIDILVDVCNFHGVSVDYMLGLTNNPKRNY